MIPVICIIILPLNSRPGKFWKLERVAYLAIETDVDRDNVSWSIRNINNPPGIWPSHMPGEGGVRVCVDAVLLDFWCGFCGNFYVKLRYCGFTKSSGLLYLEILGGISMLCSFAVFVPRLCPPPRVEEHLTIGWVEWGIWTENVSEMEDCKGKKPTF